MLRKLADTEWVKHYHLVLTNRWNSCHRAGLSGEALK